MQNIVTQVSQGNEAATAFANASNDQYNDEENGNSLIHLNIQEHHYFLTRDQLMSLSESLLLCLFPSGVFLDRMGQVISNLTPNDEVYISDFAPLCFEYMMDVYLKAYDDLINYPVASCFNISPDKSMNNTNVNNAYMQPSEDELLHEKPVIIVLREDLDYYCVPQVKFQFEIDPHLSQQITDGDLLHHLMSEIKIAAGNYLSSKTLIFDGLKSSNKTKNILNSFNAADDSTLKQSENEEDKEEDAKLGAAEQHLMDMLCSSGFGIDSQWGNRTQEHGKTIISSLSVCRLYNETTEDFRDKYNESIKQWEQSNAKEEKSPLHKPELYDLVEKPDLNTKLLLFWRKPARKCWWGGESVNLNVEVYGNYIETSSDDGVKTIRLVAPLKDDGSELRKITIPLKLHIRRVWTLELSLIGMQ
ncbi:hypothetical protein TPHA_0C00250 [Tetrapisispora phaffii CBS 4417]|uniref:Uncharacterized protein n=1 Tax=Tetrapisispora phaffii (strain ATCC 24235 / CBS 4417 / NBRC 1672 / NRRL Y-8282 / UCD 70-5) TaxID=1071381 RepID=G8BR06_TETPH|nr:hypothetical protein TPHA_0C00250 [Tetrapisispora phaffii CBS 4417]CCE62182.1 hypothetical protein TPHA_0C00250 [Tetrapisispora phaffii CBS 4417]